MRWFLWLVAIAVTAFGFSAYMPGALPAFGIPMLTAGTQVLWGTVLLGLLAISAATVVAGRTGFLLTTLGVLLAWWSWQHPAAPLALLQAVWALPAQLLGRELLAQLGGALPRFDLFWMAVAGAAGLALAGRLVFSPRVE